MSPIPPQFVDRFGDAIVVASDGAWELALPPDKVRAALEYLGREAEPAWPE